jgi:hypothetical protein
MDSPIKARMLQVHVRTSVYGYLPKQHATEKVIFVPPLLTTTSVKVSEIATLNHERRDDPVKNRSLVMQGFS